MDCSDLGGAAVAAMSEDKMDQRVSVPPYVLVTPARNEEAFIAKTIESVIRQTVLPMKWVIVNDGSTDSTGSIAAKYAASHNWIEVVNRPVRKERNFAAKVHAFNAGQEKLKNVQYEIIGNLDSDVALDEDHFEFLLNKFKKILAWESPGQFSERKAVTVRKPAVLKGKTTFPASASCSGANASRKSADILRIRPVESIGLRSPRLE